MYRMRPYSLRFQDDDEERDFQESYAKQSLSYVRIASGLGVVLYSAFGVLDAVVAPGAKNKLWAIRYGILVPSAVILFLLTYRSWFLRFSQQIISFIILLGGLGIVGMIALSKNAGADPESGGAHPYYAGLVLMLMFCYTFSRLRFVYATAVASTFIVAYEITATTIIETPVDVFLSNNFFFIGANVIGMFACYNMERYIRKEFAKRRLLQAEEEKTERLLLNILPAPIADRLRKGEELIVDRLQHVTILFADIVGFTEVSSRISAEALVTFLNEIFSMMDDAAGKYGLEKIKTIGDGYMAAGGIPTPRNDHAEAVADMALEVQAQINEMEPAKDGWLRIRMGIHSGPVVAGVIGKKKFSYDLWGNTVNVASRMERSSLPGCILVSSATYEVLKGKYTLIDRGSIQIKGKGEMRCYLLVSKAETV